MALRHCQTDRLFQSIDYWHIVERTKPKFVLFSGRHQNTIYKIAENFFIFRIARIVDVAILIELQRCGYLCKLIFLWTQLMKWNVNWDFFSLLKYYKSFVLDVWYIYYMNSIHFFHTFKFHKCINIRNPIIRLLFLIVSNAIWLYHLTKKNIFSKNPLIIFCAQLMF